MILILHEKRIAKKHFRKNKAILEYGKWLFSDNKIMWQGGCLKKEIMTDWEKLSRVEYWKWWWSKEVNNKKINRFKTGKEVFSFLQGYTDSKEQDNVLFRTVNYTLNKNNVKEFFKWYHAALNDYLRNEYPKSYFAKISGGMLWKPDSTLFEQLYNEYFFDDKKHIIGDLAYHLGVWNDEINHGNMELIDYLIYHQKKKYQEMISNF